MIHSSTESIEVSRFLSSGEIGEQLAAKAGELIATARQEPGVRAAQEKREAAEAEVARLAAAGRRVANRARDLAGKIQDAREQTDKEMIDGSTLQAAAWDRLNRLEAEHRSAVRASARIAESLAPLASIAVLEASAAEYSAHAAELRRVAAERIQRTAQLMAGAADHEGGIVFDPRKTVSGLLEAQAEDLDRRAEEHRRWAAEKRDKHSRLLEEIRTF